MVFVAVDGEFMVVQVDGNVWDVEDMDTNTLAHFKETQFEKELYGDFSISEEEAKRIERETGQAFKYDAEGKLVPIRMSRAERRAARFGKSQDHASAQRVIRGDLAKRVKCRIPGNTD